MLSLKNKTPRRQSSKNKIQIVPIISQALVNFGLVQKLLSVLNKVLEKLGRYDEGTMMGGFLGMMVRVI